MTGGLVRGPVSSILLVFSACASWEKIGGEKHQGYTDTFYEYNIMSNSACADSDDDDCDSVRTDVVGMTMNYAWFQAPRSLGAGACRACGLNPAAAIVIRGLGRPNGGHPIMDNLRHRSGQGPSVPEASHRLIDNRIFPGVAAGDGINALHQPVVFDAHPLARLSPPRLEPTL